MYFIQQLRKRKRAQRSAICIETAMYVGTCILNHLSYLSVWQKARHVAVYLPVGGEVDTTAIIDALWQRHKHCYLPVVQSHRFMLQFVRYTQYTQLLMNQFSILEPKMQDASWLHRQQLDMVLLPLTVFTSCGRRVGMGGGFYDRTFSFLKKNRNQTQKKPLLFGLAYEFQKVNYLPERAWDVMLDGVITERHIYFNNSNGLFL